MKQMPSMRAHTHKNSHPPPTCPHTNNHPPTHTDIPPPPPTPLARTCWWTS